MHWYRFDYKKLYHELDKKRQERGLNWAELGRELRIASSTLKRTQRSQPMEADGIRAMVAWLGLAPEDFVYSSLDAHIPMAMKCVPANHGKMRRFDKNALFFAVNSKRGKNNLSWQEAAKELSINKGYLFGLIV